VLIGPAVALAKTATARAPAKAQYQGPLCLVPPLYVAFLSTPTHTPSRDSCAAGLILGGERYHPFRNWRKWSPSSAGVSCSARSTVCGDIPARRCLKRDTCFSRTDPAFDRMRSAEPFAVVGGPLRGPASRTRNETPSV